MKTDIDPIFEHRESKEFRKEFFTGLAVVIVAAFFLALLLLAIAYGEPALARTGYYHIFLRTLNTGISDDFKTYTQKEMV